MANTTIYGTQSELDRIKSGEWNRRLVGKLDKMVSAAGCAYCDSNTVILQRTFLETVESVMDEPEETVIISCACLECRSAWPIEYKVGPDKGRN